MKPPHATATPTSGGFGGGRNEEEDRVRMVLERMMMMVFLKSSSKSRGGSSSSSQLYFVDDEDENDDENKAGKKKCVWKHLDEEEERESTDVVFRCAKEIAERSFAALDVYRLHFLCFTQNHHRVCDDEATEEEEEEKRERRRASNKRTKRRKRRRRAELVLAKLLFNNGDYLCALVVLSLIVDEEDDIVSSTSAVEVEEDDDIEEETKTLEGKCVEEISKKRLEKKKREKSFANTHKQEHEQEHFEQDSVDVTTTPSPTRTQQNANFFYDDIPAVLLRNGAYETSKAIGLARLASRSTSTDRTNNIINDEQIAAANAYNVALACLGANNDLESALELLSGSDVLRTYRFDQNYWLRVSSCMLQWHDKTKSKKTSDENRRLLKLVSSCIRSAKFVKELRQRGWNIFLILRSRGRDTNKEEEEDENDDDESVSYSSALLDEICDRFKVAELECKSGSTIT